ncbi:PEP-CTERM system histidine kinase PrsK [Stakelama sediminis]|uniref:histidine kinase n=1 Tax=Stakelama sediminis TaxID=463200 RepID=A0A840YZY1_9SPHN|nr:XrtA/PEP-CTERM system histidine kinase PrsK [Stakelama sediminis]MBB5719099.1 putative PEP-CTERM system histidine kinase [Stakelama sediminis]
MTAAVILWGHALAALSFAALALLAMRRVPAGLPRRGFVAALACTALWALAVAGIGETAAITQVMGDVRNLVWLVVLLIAYRANFRQRPPVALRLVYAVLLCVILAALLLDLFAEGMKSPHLAEQMMGAALLFRLMAVVTALLLVQSLFAAAGRPVRTVLLALAGMWLIDSLVLAFAYADAHWPLGLIALRGGMMIAVAGGIALAMYRGNQAVQVSRTIAYQSLSLVAIVLYLAVMTVATSMIAALGGDQARLWQTAFVIGSSTALLTLLSSPWLRAWTKVKVAKHLFRHRYDYRAEWLRFTDTLGQPTDGVPLGQRVVKAVADLVDSPAGVLLLTDGARLAVGETWNWDAGDLPENAADDALARHLAISERIIELDPVRREKAPAEDIDATPQWMLALADAWVIVPLPHLGTLTGAILLARPPLDRALDWEDFDLLRIVGRQVASYLAEARAHEALAEAQRFEEFNRRFAFILHDIKNLVSQLTLVARNAERHADNPEFRADMVATLNLSATRMNDLLARLSNHAKARSEAVRPVDMTVVAEDVAGRSRGQHPVTVIGERHMTALADPVRLETLLGHLVQNAIEASPAEEAVTIAIGHDTDRITLDVIDQGCGMSQAFIRDQLFRPFVSSKSGGFGIGAFEALQLAQAMGGTLTVTSREGAGSRFRLTLPASAGHDHAVEEAA